jgi:hypothetical protein
MFRISYFSLLFSGRQQSNAAQSCLKNSYDAKRKMCNEESIAYKASSNKKPFCLKLRPFLFAALPNIHHSRPKYECSTRNGFQAAPQQNVIKGN